MSGLVGTSGSKSGIIQGTIDTAQVWGKFASDADDYSSYGVASYVDDATGKWTVNFLNALHNADYTHLTDSADSHGNDAPQTRIVAQTTTSCQVQNIYGGSYTDSGTMTFVIFGNSEDL